MKKLFFALPIILLAVGCSPFSVTPAPAPVACSQEAKQCPDGSYVGRAGPNCEFTACPTLSSGIQGTSTLGPTCPLQRIPPDPNCADKPYQASIIVKTADGQSEVSRFTTNTDGTFKTDLKPGTYLLVPTSGSVYPRGIPQTVIVSANAYAQVNILFDSGIR